jgi:signal transduction histidine kinase
MACARARSVLVIPLRSGFDNFGVLVYASDQMNAFDSEQQDLMTAIGYQATIALQNAVLYQNLVEEKEKLIEVEEETRKQLARDLHDGPTQTISAIAMRVATLQRNLDQAPAQVYAELRRIEELARRSTREIRHMLFTLRPMVLETHGLLYALKQFADKTKETHNQNVVIRVTHDVENALDANQQGVLFYIIEEAVNNARKHARASQITVNIQRRSDVVVVQITDNGVGFNPVTVDLNKEVRGSYGMMNMRERAEMLNGTLRVESAEGHGTSITLYIPLKDGTSGFYGEAIEGYHMRTKLAVAASQRIERAFEAARRTG